MSAGVRVAAFVALLAAVFAAAAFAGRVLDPSTPPAHEHHASAGRIPR